MIPERIFFIILNMSLTGSLMILAVLFMRLFLRKAPKIFSYMLWLIVLFRLLCPVSFESEFSLLGILGVNTEERGTVEYISGSYGSDMQLGNLHMVTDPAMTDGNHEFSREETGNRDSVQNGRVTGETLRQEPMYPETLEQEEARPDTGRQENIQLEAERESSNADHTETLGLLQLLYSLQLQSVFSVGSVIWLIGVGALLLYGFGSYMHLNRKLYRPESNDPVADDISALKNRPRIYRCNDIPTAFVLGLFRPRIYLPANLDETEERYILLHEQVHIKRGDSFYRTIAYLALCLHWFNPFVWLAFHLSGMDMEMSCDEAVIRQIGSGIKKEYSQTLLALATGSSMVKGIPLAFGEGDTGSRIKNVLGYKKPTVIIVAVVLVLCLGTAIFLLGNPIRNEQEDQILNQAEEQNDDSIGNSNDLMNESQENRIEDEHADTAGAEDDGIYYTMDEIKALDIPEDMLAYWLVLNSKIPFISSNEGCQEFYFDEYFWYDDRPKVGFKYYSYLFVDLDQNGDEEMVLTGLMPETTQVFDYQDGMVYSYQFPYRGMNGILANGVYAGSSGASIGGWYRIIEFDHGTYKEETVASIYGDYYEVEGREVSEDEFYEYIKIFDDAEQAEEIHSSEGILDLLDDYLLEGLTEEEIYILRHVVVERMSETVEYSSDSEIMHIYYDVLISEGEFISVTDDGQVFCLEDYQRYKDSQVVYFSFVDMNQDGIVELVLTYSYNTQILYYEGGSVYSYLLDYDKIGAIANNGLFETDFQQAFGKIVSFNEDGCVIEEIDYNGNINDDRIRYYYFSEEMIERYFN